MLAGEPPPAKGPPDCHPSLKRCMKKMLKMPREKGKGKFKKNEKKRKGVFLYESSLGKIRLMTSPFIRSRHAPSKQINIWTE